MRYKKGLVCILVMAMMLTVLQVFGFTASSDMPEKETVVTDIPGMTILACEDEALNTIGTDAGTTLSLSDDAKVGSKSLKVDFACTGGSNSSPSFWYDGASLDLSGYNISELALSYWIKCTPSDFPTVQMLLRTEDGSGVIDNRLGNWFDTAGSAADQWIHVVNPIGGSLPYSDNFKGIRFSLNWPQTASISVLLDDIRIVKLSEKYNYKYLIEAEGESGIGCSVAMGYDTTGAVGEKALMLTGSDEEMTIWKTFDSTNYEIADIEDMALTFWCKVSDLAKVEGFGVALFSDSGQISLWPTISNFVKENDTWGKIVIKFKDVAEASTFDFTTINKITIQLARFWVDGSLIWPPMDGENLWLDAVRIERIGDFNLRNYYEDGMLFQRGKPIRILGTGETGADVSAELKKDGAAVTAISGTIDENGEFVLELPEQQASYDVYTIDVTSGGTTKTINNVLIGELWLGAGQSNIEYKIVNDIDKDAILANVDNSARSKNIRIYSADATQGDKNYYPQADVENAHWVLGTSAGAISMVSSLNYNYALKLFDQLNVDGAEIPVGILSITKGASPLSAWMSRELWDSPENAVYKSAKWPPKAVLNPTQPGEVLWNDTDGFYKATQETAMYNEYIAPISNLNIGGMLWYQGESDSSWSAGFAVGLDNLIGFYREIFSHSSAVGDIPFIAIQPSPHNYNTAAGAPYDGLPELWEAYVKAMKNHDNVAVMPIYDLPLDFNNIGGAIHPGKKTPVGIRAAEMAYRFVYDETAAEYSGPIYKSMSVSGNKITVTFEHVGTGLKSTDGSTQLHGFAICSSDRVFYNAEAKIVSDDKVEVWCENLTSPVAVTYAWSPMNMKSNLAGSLNIPALPFRSDETASTLYRLKDWQYCDDQNLWINRSVLGGEYDFDSGFEPAWSLASGIAAGASFTFDGASKSEGTKALKLTYTAAGLTGVTPILEYNAAGNSAGYPGTYNQFEKYKTMYFDLYNHDNRTKSLEYVELVNYSGTVYRLRVLDTENTKADIASEAWTTVGVSLTDAFDSAGQKAPGFTAANIKSMNFIFRDTAGGAVSLDNIRFTPAATETPVEPSSESSSELSSEPSSESSAPSSSVSSLTSSDVTSSVTDNSDNQQGNNDGNQGNDGNQDDEGSVKSGVANPVLLIAMIGMMALGAVLTLKKVKRI